MATKILLAADEISCLLSSADLLRDAGYLVEICTEGPRFLQMARDCAPDLGILCASLPMWDVFSLGRQAKADPSLSHVPLLVIAKSWNTVAQETSPGRESPGDAFMVAPFGAQELVAHVHSLEQISATRRALQRWEDELAALRKMSKAIAGVAGLEEMLDAVLATAIPVLESDAGIVFLEDAEGESLSVALHRGITGGLARLLDSLPVEALMLDTLHQMNGSRTIRVADLEAHVLKPALVNEGFSMVAAAPLLALAHRLGLLAVASRRRQELSPRELDLLTAISQQAGLALESAKLYDALQQERDLATMMLDTMSEGLLLEDAQGLVTFANPATCRMLGLQSEDIQGRPVMDLFHGLERDKVRARMAERVHGRSNRFESVLVGRDRQLVPVLINETALFQDGERQGTLTVFTDIAALREAERATRESEERYRVLAEESPFGILIVQGTKVLYRNRRAEAWWDGGCEIEEAFPFVRPEDRAWVLDWVSQQLAGKERGPAEIQFEVPGPGEARWFVLRGSPIQYASRSACLITALDITEQKRAEQAMLRAERLRALGQMAGGIAHNFNNILASIQGYLDLAVEDREDQQALGEHLEHIKLGTTDAAQAVRRLQTLYRVFEDTSDFLPLELSAIIDDAIDLTRPRWRDEPQRDGVTIQVTTDYQARAFVAGNASELREVITNLILNAVDAMPEGGTLSISARDEGDAIVLRVADNGTGMSQEALAKVWEPFFTTKGATGSGLGLAISRRAIRRHGGEITVQSAPGVGTTFAIRLPASETKPAPPSLVAGRDVPTGCNILVVDDEPTVAALLQRMLVRQGQEVTAVMSGQEALDALEQKSFSMVITDLGMPNVSGAAVARRARQLYPEMPVVLATGWSDTITPERMAEMGVEHLLPKPFTYDQLRTILAEQLHAPGSGAH